MSLFLASPFLLIFAGDSFPDESFTGDFFAGESSAGESLLVSLFC